MLTEEDEDEEEDEVAVVEEEEVEMEMVTVEEVVVDEGVEIGGDRACLVLSHTGVWSPVARHDCATFGPHSHGSFCPPGSDARTHRPKAREQSGGATPARACGVRVVPSSSRGVHSHMLKWIGRPVALSACDIRAYVSAGCISPWLHPATQCRKHRSGRGRSRAGARAEA